MIRLILHRVLLSIPLILLVAAVSFVLQAMVPGDTARTMLGANATQEDYEALRQQLHLDQPLIVRFGDYLGGLIHGDLGASIFTSIPVHTTIAQRLPITLCIVIGAALLATSVGVLLGVFSATRGKRVSKAIDALSMVGFALPNFWLALILASVFAMALPLFPATGYTYFSDDPLGWLLCLVLPWVALSLHGIASIAKVTRDGMKSALDADYIRTLRAAGVGRTRLIWKHALRNAGIPVSTMAGLTIIQCIGGSILIESVFALPGLGSLAVNGINNHDTPITQGVVLTFTLIVIVVNLLVDLAYSVLNPKVRVS